MAEKDKHMVTFQLHQFYTLKCLQVLWSTMAYVGKGSISSVVAPVEAACNLPKGMSLSG